ncbi:YqzL family protein [Paenibacillus kobensis]|uniref:YqzL family protein n=1 Tax=Paenibacillus kobensis TaxID=59841 RepID=UPI000FDC97C1|nr:YqzL family protein [Paenibacillus kobensis]
MRDFSWKYFALTGSVDAFLLYKEMHQISDAETADEAAAFELGGSDEEEVSSPV